MQNKRVNAKVSDNAVYYHFHLSSRFKPILRIVLVFNGMRQPVAGAGPSVLTVGKIMVYIAICAIDAIDGR